LEAQAQRSYSQSGNPGSIPGTATKIHVKNCLAALIAANPPAVIHMRLRAHFPAEKLP